MEYGFSKIKTEELREAKKSRKDVCCGIMCSKCHFNGAVCDAGNNDMIYDEFCKELDRREKMENKMPELKNGMILEIYIKNIDTSKYLYLDGVCYDLNGNQYIVFEGCERDVLNIYEITNPSGFKSISNNLNLIWSKKSDKDIKIEELEKELQYLEEDHSKKVSEIRDRLQELKG